MIAAFWTISIDTRLVMTTAPAAALRCAERQSAPASLSERIVTADVFARRYNPFARLT